MPNTQKKMKEKNTGQCVLLDELSSQERSDVKHCESNQDKWAQFWTLKVWIEIWNSHSQTRNFSTLNTADKQTLKNIEEREPGV